MLVGWQNPPQGWVAVNTDGALRRNTNMVATGGVFRDYNGYWLGRFAAKLGKCSSYRVELWIVLHSLRIAKEKGFSRIWLQVYNKIVVQVITSSALHPCANSDLLNTIHGLLQLDWEVKISHIYRKRNMVADGMVNISFNLDSSFILFDVPPPEISSRMFNDVLGVCFPKMVRN
ncbi:Non-LTR retroelement reverse transcriptase-like, putative [Theobroma cacao]|uniref:Non-LTR retroelement reverse transcriptase-like, putative n=1 Tax=Theobroma cacao TaxID=3641 RepID=A0A061FCP9_THECC|nr:Non-LTR retroelement reverse transcriptase-like, putative [Theobroma cacao]